MKLCAERHWGCASHCKRLLHIKVYRTNRRDSSSDFLLTGLFICNALQTLGQLKPINDKDWLDLVLGALQIDPG